MGLMVEEFSCSTNIFAVTIFQCFPFTFVFKSHNLLFFKKKIKSYAFLSRSGREAVAEAVSSMKTALGKIFAIKTKLFVLFSMLVIMFYPVMYNQRTIDPKQQMSIMLCLPAILALTFWSFTNI